MTGEKTAVIIGAGPAGLTAALEFARRSEIKPIVLEASEEIGGISRTIRYKGNRMDIGGHRFFSKSDRVMDWWTALMPISGGEDGAERYAVRYQNKEREVSATTTDSDLVMLVRPRKSRIYFLRSFFTYPLSLDAATLRLLGLRRTFKIGMGYLRAKLFPRKPEKTLEDFLINRFGVELYLTFFKSYTEKVWGVPCDQISAEWGAQRIKGLSLRTAVLHFLKKTFGWRRNSKDVQQKGTETSLIEKYLYPKYGPGQLWEHVAELVKEKGGEVRTGWRVTKLHAEGSRIGAVEAVNRVGEKETIRADYVFSTMPIRELIRGLDCDVPANVREVSEGLVYRDFVTVGLLADKLSVTEPDGGPLKDTWIYIQEPDVLLGRLQIFNNWSPYMVADPEKIWIGLEYFCYETDPLWKMPDEEIATFAIAEVEKIGILKKADVRDAHVVRVPKTYPAYFGTYDRFDEIVEYVSRFQNLYLVGRNGMHKYNNQDHSMLTAMTSVDNILAGMSDKSVIWNINTEQDYHEAKK
ncbi:MAG TPA: NAD(P)/FAD-dependent oxidoreductase [Silvibacterium sp.]|nr:NAD(P)/FAD-dependent oxidoreductase [Silvibacterium sp.]